MVDGLVATLGLYGGAFVIGFVAGMFPIVSIEAFLIAATALKLAPGGLLLAVLIAVSAIGHQIAKTVTYYAGAGAFELPQGNVKARIEAARARIDRWNKRPKLVMMVAALIGLPPLWLLGIIAKPLMHMSFTTFTVISLAGRLVRYTTLVVVTSLF